MRGSFTRIFRQILCGDLQGFFYRFDNRFAVAVNLFGSQHFGFMQFPHTLGAHFCQRDQRLISNDSEKRSVLLLCHFFTQLQQRFQNCQASGTQFPGAFKSGE